jgi:hypothetical protein
MTEAPTALRCQVETGPAGLERIRIQWEDLVRRIPDAAFYQQYAWNRAVLENLEEDPAAAHWFVFSGDRAVVAIIPLRRGRWFAGVVPLRAWTSPTHHHVVLNDFPLLPGIPSGEVLRALIRNLASANLPGWDILRLTGVLAGGNTATGLQEIAAPRTLLVRSSGSMHFDCQDYTAVMDRAGGHFRRNLKRQRRKLEQRGSVSTHFERDPAKLEQALSEFLRLESSGWKGDVGKASAIALHPRLLAFYRSLVAQYGPGGHCQINLLSLDGVPIAAQFCLRAGATLNILKIAYDENFAAEAPGNQLLDGLLQECCADPAITRLSLVTGPAWGQRWAPVEQDVWTITLANTSLRGRLGIIYQRMRSAIAARLRRYRARAAASAMPAPSDSTEKTAN